MATLDNEFTCQPCTPEPATPEPGQVLRKCCTCQLEKPESEVKLLGKSDMVFQTYQQMRCTLCIAAMSRTRYLIKVKAIEGYDDLKDEHRTGYYAKVANLYGSNMAKVLTESITKCRLDRQVSRWEQTGQAEKFDDVEKQYKNKPEEWATILANAQQFPCSVTGKAMIVAHPVYTL